jgi:hypothetical protein
MKELIRVNTFMEAQDVKLYLGSEGIECDIPDQYSLGITGFAAFGRGTGRILVHEADYEQALTLLKNWNSFYVSKDPNPAQRLIEHPFMGGISPRQILHGSRRWKELRFLQKVKVIGGVFVIFAVLAVFGWNRI